MYITAVFYMQLSKYFLLLKTYCQVNKTPPYLLKIVTDYGLLIVYC
jgi:hypothetical protein